MEHLDIHTEEHQDYLLPFGKSSQTAKRFEETLTEVSSSSFKSSDCCDYSHNEDLYASQDLFLSQDKPLSSINAKRSRSIFTNRSHFTEAEKKLGMKCGTAASRISPENPYKTPEKKFSNSLEELPHPRKLFRRSTGKKKKDSWNATVMDNSEKRRHTGTSRHNNRIDSHIQQLRIKHARRLTDSNSSQLSSSQRQDYSETPGILSIPVVTKSSNVQNVLKFSDSAYFGIDSTLQNKENIPKELLSIPNILSEHNPSDFRNFPVLGNMTTTGESDYGSRNMEDHLVSSKLCLSDKQNGNIYPVSDSNFSFPKPYGAITTIPSDRTNITLSGPHFTRDTTSFRSVITPETASRGHRKRKFPEISDTTVINNVYSEFINPALARSDSSTSSAKQVTFSHWEDVDPWIHKRWKSKTLIQTQFEEE